MNNDVRKISMTKDTAEFVSDILGQLSDGYWENRPSMGKYWYFAHINDSCLLLSKERYVDDFFTKKLIYNQFLEMDDTKVKKFFADKIKFMIKAEAKDFPNRGMIFSPDCSAEAKYLHGTCADAYKAYRELLA